MAYEDIQGLRRNEDGTLTIIDLVKDTATGEILYGGGYPLLGDETGETIDLEGWGSMDGTATVYETAGGTEILIPATR